MNTYGMKMMFKNCLICFFFKGIKTLGAGIGFGFEMIFCIKRFVFCVSSVIDFRFFYFFRTTFIYKFKRRFISSAYRTSIRRFVTLVDISTNVTFPLFHGMTPFKVLSLIKNV
eukprot:gnl/Chilomastix_cuspidata/10242.p1 GENE.gnl/Chilomastix_cuspidata/10242~~gnl/Chilomastix_cuspidata/10242.p1  ORF type:complete len:122 (+),score=0.90 gnl/Chilomastix_cuspidata/10242:29-367(+)